jgi:hypothetical protein
VPEGPFHLDEPLAIEKAEQYVAVLSGIGGWPGIGLAAGLTDPRAGLGAVGAFSALNS